MGSPKTLTREELYDLVWSKPMSQLAPEFGLSDQGLAKKCKKHHIPRPSVGYWAKVSSGKNVRRIPLADIGDSALEMVEFYQKPESGKKQILEDSLGLDEYCIRAADYEFPERVHRYHDLLKQFRKTAKKRDVDPYGRMVTSRKCSSVGIKVSPGTYDRACRFLQGIIELFESYGWMITESSTYRGEPGDAAFEFDHEQLKFELIERVKRVVHVPDPKEKWAPKYDYIPAKTLEFRIENCYSPGFKIAWKDKKNEVLENQLISITQGFARAFAYAKQRTIENERQQREWREEERRRAEMQRLEEIEQRRRAHLFELVQCLDQANAIRALIKEIRRKNACEEGLDDWLDWAGNVAKELDVTSRAKEILNKHQLLSEEASFTPSW